MSLGLCNALVAVFPWSAEYLREYADEKHRLQACSGFSDVRDEYPLNRMLYRYCKGSFIENHVLHHHAIA